MIGSHNSFSYLPPKAWWMRLFGFMGKCQRVNIQDQYEKYDARLFDIRVRFDKKEKVYLCHGFANYGYWDTIKEALEWLKTRPEKVSVRVMLETGKPHEREEGLFYNFCHNLCMSYPEINFFGGMRKFDFKVIYRFENKPKLIDRYSSTTSLFKSNSKFLRIIDDWIPIYYAKKYNRKNMELYKDTKKYLFIDFVDIR